VHEESDFELRIDDPAELARVSRVLLPARSGVDLALDGSLRR
jgi:hypothetical protein